MLNEFDELSELIQRARINHIEERQRIMFEYTQKEKRRRFLKKIKEHILGIFSIFMIWVGITIMTISTAWLVKSVLF